MSFQPPGPAEILRAHQKDQDFIERIQEYFIDLVQQYFGQRFWQKWRVWLERVPHLTYYSLTTLSGFQTLGEEYTGILQVDSTHKKIPTTKKIATMIFLHTFGKLVIEKSLQRTNTFLSDPPKTTTSLESRSTIEASENEMTWLKKFIPKLLHGISLCLPFMTQFHLTLFFFSGKFYHFSKRLTGIHYILVRKWFANQTQQSLTYLVWLSVFNLFLSMLRDAVGFIVARQQKSFVNIQSQTSPSSTSINELQQQLEKNRNNEEMKEEDGSGKKCSLCLEVRQHPSVTPCGHLFCWECILDWVQTKQECPICRDIVTPSRIVPLQNFS